jgi:hypothetical protein
LRFSCLFFLSAPAFDQYGQRGVDELAVDARLGAEIQLLPQFFQRRRI